MVAWEEMAEQHHSLFLMCVSMAAGVKNDGFLYMQNFYSWWSADVCCQFPENWMLESRKKSMLSRNKLSIICDLGFMG